MNRRKEPIDPELTSCTPQTRGGIHSRCEHSGSRKLIDLPLGKELLELCTEIAGALLRGYSEGESGGAVRRVITVGLIEKMSCSSIQARSLVDLSLELIHLQAFGKYRSDSVELSLLVARSGGEVGDCSLN